MTQIISSLAEVALTPRAALPGDRRFALLHQAALHHNHRSLLVVAGLPPETVPEIQAEVEALGLAAVLRSEDDDPEADDQVLIAEDSYEMGLWYRLAPVCFMGGTLFEGPSLPPRHPFEPAALGSAIIHGPLPGPHAAEWIQLDGASAARLVARCGTSTPSTWPTWISTRTNCPGRIIRSGLAKRMRNGTVPVVSDTAMPAAS